MLSWQTTISLYDACFKRGKRKKIYTCVPSYFQSGVSAAVTPWHDYKEHLPPSHSYFPIPPFFNSHWRGLSRKFFITRSIGNYLFRLKEIPPLYPLTAQYSYNTRTSSSGSHSSYIIGIRVALYFYRL